MMLRDSSQMRDVQDEGAPPSDTSPQAPQPRWAPPPYPPPPTSVDPQQQQQQQQQSANGNMELMRLSSGQLPTPPSSPLWSNTGGYLREVVPAAAIRGLLAPYGIAIPKSLQSTSGTPPEQTEDVVVLHTFPYTKQLRVSFCQYFFAVFSGHSIVHAEPLCDAARSSSASVLTGTTPNYEVNTQGFLLPPSLALSTIMTERLSEALSLSHESRRAVDSTGPFAGQRRDSPCASGILRQLRHHFKPRTSPGRDEPTHAWDNTHNMIQWGSLVELAFDLWPILQAEPTLLHIRPPCYVIGDIHGNFRDLMCFVEFFGLLKSADFVPAKFLFLGDYVDRGPHSIETVAFLFAMKRLYPDKVFLLRGNHEMSDINGDIGGYREGSFKKQCRNAYGPRGDDLWGALNQAFNLLPLAAVVDQKIFCVHGGLPRWMSANPRGDILATIASITRPTIPGDEHDLIAYDLLWSDPAEDECGLGMGGFPDGFGENLRGSTACVFGQSAVKQFFARTGCTHLVRAHQATQLGIQVKTGATVFTVFSSSGYSEENRAAAVLVNESRIDVIMVDTASTQTDPVLLSNSSYWPAPPPNATTPSFDWQHS